MTAFGIEFKKPQTSDIFFCAISIAISMAILDSLGDIKALTRSQFLGLLMASAGGSILAACGCSITKGLKPFALLIVVSASLGLLGRQIGLLIY